MTGPRLDGPLRKSLDGALSGIAMLERRRPGTTLPTLTTSCEVKSSQKLYGSSKCKPPGTSSPTTWPSPSRLKFVKGKKNTRTRISPVSKPDTELDAFEIFHPKQQTVASRVIPSQMATSRAQRLACEQGQNFGPARSSPFMRPPYPAEQPSPVFRHLMSKLAPRRFPQAQHSPLFQELAHYRVSYFVQCRLAEQQEGLPQVQALPAPVQALPAPAPVPDYEGLEEKENTSIPGVPPETNVAGRSSRVRVGSPWLAFKTGQKTGRPAGQLDAINASNLQRSYSESVLYPREPAQNEQSAMIVGVHQHRSPRGETLLKKRCVSAGSAAWGSRAGRVGRAQYPSRLADSVELATGFSRLAGKV
mmetsp:Transcript_34778/g.79343  ORF Transcript_34778/g.79343 Transcript_34778/m.79343 type:complete len:361 (-) Transcript_34778:45-1127(-)|eukprot:CAMPEP_0114561008 /NCGR_PEP_ID=MMETSP0114-20121206/11772_1 /TAXON_ID=31324 /ORGANISM="Goniomonas sp, Strain m" /LENGTH=360 /DNA_ID=CAMNT_0001746609 /DNA_START=50 /DNA_END=1132 /DNA_ORIENTATION=+